jgi:hypothetical protein
MALSYPVEPLHHELVKATGNRQQAMGNVTYKLACSVLIHAKNRSPEAVKPLAT